jgi:hypothetical protein
MGGIHEYDMVQPGASERLLAMLPSPPQCHTAVITMPHFLVSVDHSPVIHLMKCYSPP